MKTFYAIKSVVWFIIFSLDFTYDRDIWSMAWLLLAIISTINYLQMWIEDKLKTMIK